VDDRSTARHPLSPTGTTGSGDADRNGPCGAGLVGPQVIDSYFEELGRINATLDRRGDENNGRHVEPINGD
jgi:hypothetical protein